MTREQLKRRAIRYMWICGLFFLLLMSPMLISWALYGFDPYFFAIDSCLDSGGRWNDATLACEYTAPFVK